MSLITSTPRCSPLGKRIRESTPGSHTFRDLHVWEMRLLRLEPRRPEDVALVPSRDDDDDDEYDDDDDDDDTFDTSILPNVTRKKTSKPSKKKTLYAPMTGMAWHNMRRR